MASLKIPLQIICPNCQQGNFPGSPYCNGCGAPLSEVPPGTTAISKAEVYANEIDAINRFLSEGQDRALVKQSYERAFAILTSGESIEYIAVAGRANLGHAPDCVVATTKRIILLRKKVLGKYELDDCYWRDVRNAILKDVKNAVSLSLEAIQGWRITVESLPKAQAWRIYEIAVQYSQRLREFAGERSVGAISNTNTPAPWPTMQSGSVLARRYAKRYAAGDKKTFTRICNSLTRLSLLRWRSLVSSTPAAMPGTDRQRVPGTTGRFDAQGGLESEQPAGNAMGFVPTPESVLQSILHQSQGVSDGAPTRPIQFAAAAFQAPATPDAQPLTMRETTTDPHMRPAPPMPTLEHIAVFSGPLAFSHLPLSDVSAPVDQYSLHRLIMPPTSAS